MKTINKCIASIGGLAVIVALPFIVRSCSIAQSNSPSMQGEYKGAHYSFANNGIVGYTYKITLNDGTKLRCDDIRGSCNDLNNIIDSVIVYNKDGKISKIYKNSLTKIDENDEFLTSLTAQVKEAKQYIIGAIESEKERQKQELKRERQKQIEKEQSELLNKVKGEN